MDQSNGSASNECHSRIFKRWIPWNQTSSRQKWSQIYKKNNHTSIRPQRENWAHSTCTIYSIDAEKMYPTTTFGLVNKRAVNYFSSDFLPGEKETINIWEKLYKHAAAMKRKHGHENWEDIGSSCGSDAFAKHFGSDVRHAKNSNAARAIIKSLLYPTILWQGDRIKCIKSATTLKCTLCMQERKELMMRFRFDIGKMINDNLEIYRPCMCKTNFHRLARDLET